MMCELPTTFGQLSLRIAPTARGSHLAKKREKEKVATKIAKLSRFFVKVNELRVKKRAEFLRSELEKNVRARAQILRFEESFVVAF